MQISLQIPMPTKINVFTTKPYCSCMLNQCFFAHISKCPNYIQKRCIKTVYLHVQIFKKLHTHAITPLNLHDKPRFKCMKLHAHENMVVNLQLQCDFGTCISNHIQNIGLPCRFNAHFDDSAANNKKRIGLPPI